MKSAGANISILTAKINSRGEQYTFIMEVVHFSFFPRYTFNESENSSLSIGSPLGIGIGLLSSAGDASGIAWSADVPVVIDYNIGCKSTPDNERNFGGYFGAGFGVMYTGWTGGSEAVSSAITFGPLVRAGIRIGSERWNMTIGGFFKLGLEKEKYKTFGFNVYKDF